MRRVLLVGEIRPRPLHILSWQYQSASWRASKCSVSATEHTSKKTTPRQELQSNRTSGAAIQQRQSASDQQRSSNIATTTRQRIATCSHRYCIMMHRHAPSTNASASGKQQAATCLHRTSHIVTTARRRTATSHIVCQRGATCNNAPASGCQRARCRSRCNIVARGIFWTTSAQRA